MIERVADGEEADEAADAKPRGTKAADQGHLRQEDHRPRL